MHTSVPLHGPKLQPRVPTLAKPATEQCLARGFTYGSSVAMAALLVHRAAVRAVGGSENSGARPTVCREHGEGRRSCADSSAVVRRERSSPEAKRDDDRR